MARTKAKKNKKERIAKQEQKLFGYKIKIHSECTYSHHSNHQYGEYHEIYDNYFETVTQEEKYPDVTSCFDLTEGYAVWLEYSTGDSFGQSERSQVIQMGIFKDEVPAQELAEKIRRWRPKADSTRNNEHE